MKRGQGMSVQTVVLIILGLIVLAIIVLVVRQQVTKGASRYTDIGEKAEITEGKCNNIILGRGCSADPCSRDKGLRNAVSAVGWDCPSDKPNCCEPA